MREDAGQGEGLIGMPGSEPDVRDAEAPVRLTEEAGPVRLPARVPFTVMPAERWPMRRLLAGAGALAAAIVALIGYGVLRGHEAATPPAGATIAPTGVVSVTEAQMHQIKLGKVEQRSFQDERLAVGQIALNEDATTPIYPPYPGRVARLLARSGDVVKRGEVLFEIDSPDLVQAESALIAAATTFDKTRGQLDLTNRVLARQRELTLAQAGSQKDLDQAEANQRTAENEYHGASGALAAALDAVKLFGKSEAELNRIKDQRRIDPVMPVTAPLAGTVVARKAGPGQFVQPSNSEPVYTIADLSHMWLVANVAELDIPYVHLGDRVAVKVAAYPNETFQAKITNIGATVDPTTRRVTVRSEIEPKGRPLKPQMFASFRIITDAGTPSPAVPTGALTRDGDKATVWVEVAPRQFAPRTVNRGAEQDGMAQILSGVAPGETVAIEGGVYLGNVGATVTN